MLISFSKEQTRGKQLHCSFQWRRIRRNIMYDAIDITEKEITTYENEADMPNFEMGNSKLGIGIIMSMAAIVGVWGITCLISGLANTGLHEVGRSLITAITGI
jgi:hypothetical protein